MIVIVHNNNYFLFYLDFGTVFFFPSAEISFFFDLGMWIIMLDQYQAFHLYKVLDICPKLSRTFFKILPSALSTPALSTWLLRHNFHQLIHCPEVIICLTFTYGDFENKNAPGAHHKIIFSSKTRWKIFRLLSSLLWNTTNHFRNLTWILSSIKLEA